MSDKRTVKIEMEIHGEAALASKDNRSYAESNVCDLVSILLTNGYTVLIEMPFERDYIIKYGYKKGEIDMRDPKRIDKFCDELKAIWHCVPDWRFGQLMSNMLGEYQAEKKRDIFFPEDDELMEFFREYFKET